MGDTKKYKIILEGCHDSTVFEMVLTDKEYELLNRVSEMANKTSTCYCEPRMFVEEVES